MTESDNNKDKFFKKLYSSYISLRDSIEDHIEKQLEKVNSYNDTLKSQLEQYKAEAENLRKVSIVSNLNRQIKDLTRDNEILSKQNSKQKKTITSLNIQLEKLDDDFERFHNMSPSISKTQVEQSESDKSDVDSDVSNEESGNTSEEQADQSVSTSDSNQEEDDMDEVEISGKTYSLNNDDELLQINPDDSMSVVGKLIDDVPYFNLDCYYNMTSSGIYDKNDVSLKIGKLSKKYLANITL